MTSILRGIGSTAITRPGQNAGKQKLERKRRTGEHVPAHRILNAKGFFSGAVGGYEKHMGMTFQDYVKNSMREEAK